MSTASLPFPLAAPRKRSASKTQQNFTPINSTDPADLATDASNANGDAFAASNASSGETTTLATATTARLSLVTDLDLNSHNANDKDTTDEPLGGNSVSVSAPIGSITQITPVETKRPPPPVSVPSSSSSSTKPLLLRKPIPKEMSLKPNKDHTDTNTALSTPSIQPLQKHKAKPSKSILSNSNASATTSKSTPNNPTLRQYIHVVRLISPELPEECLKILNVPIYPDTLKIGRQNTPKTSNKITDGFFDSRVLSRNHAELFIKDNNLYIRDLKSSNGTFINDVKLEPYTDYKLSLGDKIDLGTTLESQMAHKKITCIVKDFDFVSLKDFENQVEDINNKDDLISKKMELFTSTFDAMLFGEVVDDIILDIDEVINKDDSNADSDSKDKLFDLINYNDDGNADFNDDLEVNIRKSNIHKKESPDHFVTNLDVKPGANPQELVKKLLIAVNNEYIQQQRLKELNTFLTNYKHAMRGCENPAAFKLYDKLLRKEFIDQNYGSKNSKENMEKKRIEEEQHREMERQREAKFTRMEEQLKNSLNELDLIRGHLSTAKEREMQASRLQEENNALKEMLEKYKKEIAMLQEGKEKEEVEEVEKNPNPKSNPNPKVTSGRSAPVDSLLSGLTAHAVRYGGLVALAVAVLYVAAPSVRACVAL